MSEERLEAAKAAYDHLLAARQLDDEIYKVFVDKIDRVMTKQTLVLGALGFGATQLGWADGTWWWASAISGGLAALVLAGAVLLGLYLLRTESTHVVGVSELLELLKQTDPEKGLDAISTADFYKQLGQNIAGTILEYRSEAEGRMSWSRRFNRFTQVGYLFAAVFLGFSIGGSVYKQGRTDVQQGKNAEAVTATAQAE